MERARAIRAVAIDGPAGAGKSTVARGVAEALGFLYIDSGAMYRAVTLAAMRAGANLHDPEALGAVARSCRLDFDESGTRILLDGEDVSTAIRTPEITAQVRFAASAPPVRAELVGRQRALARARPVVMEGRDITTVVLPEAQWKFYLDAAPECRARRRLKDLDAAGHPTRLEALLGEIASRDRSDLERAVGPLKRTGDQVYLDTTDLSVAEAVQQIVRRAQDGR
ncbi:MAG: (d)CMP kinase [Planctomycetota bacterium]